jgi:hypothetical protein
MKRAKVHETREIPAKDPLAVAVGPGVPVQDVPVRNLEPSGASLVEHLVQRIENPGKCPPRNRARGENAVADRIADFLQLGIRMKHLTPGKTAGMPLRLETARGERSLKGA